MRLVIPQPGEKWIRKAAKREVLVIDVKTRAHGGVEWLTTVDYRYVAGFGGAGIWRRNVVPVQTASLVDWNRLFARAA